MSKLELCWRRWRMPKQKTNFKTFLKWYKKCQFKEAKGERKYLNFSDEIWNRIEKTKAKLPLIVLTKIKNSKLLFFVIICLIILGAKKHWIWKHKLDGFGFKISSIKFALKILANLDLIFIENSKIKFTKNIWTKQGQKFIKFTSPDQFRLVYLGNVEFLIKNASIEYLSTKLKKGIFKPETKEDFYKNKIKWKYKVMISNSYLKMKAIVCWRFLKLKAFLSGLEYSEMIHYQWFINKNGQFYKNRFLIFRF